MFGDQLGKEPEHSDDLGCLQLGRARIEGAQGPKEGAVGEDDRHRNVTLKPVHRWRCMVAPILVLRDVVDDDRLPALSDFMADRAFDLQFTARLQSEVDVILHAASDPAVFGHAGDRREPHPSCAAHHVEDRGYRLYAAHAFNIGLKVLRHGRTWVHTSIRLRQDRGDSALQVLDARPELPSPWTWWEALRESRQGDL